MVGMMFKKIIISRTDSIGDVVLTLPAAGLMKKVHPGASICFIGRSYTRSIIATCEYVDEFVNWDEVSAWPLDKQLAFFESLKADAIVHVFPNPGIAKLAFMSKIPVRVGTSHRLYHWLYCNKRVALGRKKSPLHESQLNLKLFCLLGADKEYSLDQIPDLYGLTKVQPLDNIYGNLPDKERFNLILHPTSKGSAREWGLDNFSRLIGLLPKDRFKIFITGTCEDQEKLQPLLDAYRDSIIDMTGKMTLPEFISFINKADGLVAASTGPLHIASALGKVAIGLYAPMQPIHPGRWAPVGKKAGFLVLEKICDKCRHDGHCECIRSIKPEQVMEKLEAVMKQKS
jgi:heptosyltransferase III